MANRAVAEKNWQHSGMSDCRCPRVFGSLVGFRPKSSAGRYPATNGIDFSFAKAIFFGGRHLTRMNFLKKQAFIRLSGYDHWAGLAAFEYSSRRAQVQILSACFIAMTTQTF